MEAQLHRSYGTHEEQPQPTGIHSEGGVEHHEKKSVLKKVKAKAKKIKDSIKHLGHDQEHDHDQEDDEDDDEEMVDAPEVHGAPIHESSAIRSGVVPHQDVGTGAKSVGNFEHPSSRTEGGLDSDVSSEDNMRRFLQTVGEGRKEGDHIPAESGGLERTEREPGARFGVLTGSEEHPHAPMEKLDNPSQNQTKLTHPGTAQRAEAGVPPMSVVGETKPNSGRQDSSTSNVSEDDNPIEERRETALGTDQSPVEDYSHGEPERTDRAPGPKSLTGLQQDPQAPMDTPNPSNYQTKVTHPTAQRAEEAGTTPLVASFGKMSVEDETKPSSIGSATEQKRSHTGSHDQFSTPPTSTQFSPEFDTTKPEEEMPRDTIDGKPSPGQGTSSYTEMVSSAATVIADKAVTAKNVVASRLGYGGGNVEEGTHAKNQTDSATDLGYGGGKEEEGTHTMPQTGYAQKAMTAVTDTLAPIYGKVAGVGSAVVSKAPGIGSGKEGGEGISESSVNENKGRGASMKEYLAEKLRPGEEDKALSEVITDTLHVQKEKPATEGGKPIEKVTESEEVARELGRGQENEREGSDALVSGSESSGNTVVEKLTNAVSSWVTKGGESPTSHQGASSQNVEWS